MNNKIIHVTMSMGGLEPDEMKYVNLFISRPDRIRIYRRAPRAPSVGRVLLAALNAVGAVRS